MLTTGDMPPTSAVCRLDDVDDVLRNDPYYIPSFYDLPLDVDCDPTLLFWVNARLYLSHSVLSEGKIKSIKALQNHFY